MAWGERAVRSVQVSMNLKRTRIPPRFTNFCSQALFAVPGEEGRGNEEEGRRKEEGESRKEEEGRGKGEGERRKNEE